MRYAGGVVFLKEVRPAPTETASRLGSSLRAHLTSCCEVIAPGSPYMSNLGIGDFFSQRPYCSTALVTSDGVPSIGSSFANRQMSLRC